MCFEAIGARWDMPFTKLVIAVQPKDPDAVRISNLGEYVFKPDNLIIVEVFALRGQLFENKGTRYCYLTRDNIQDLERYEAVVPEPCYFEQPFGTTVECWNVSKTNGDRLAT